ncbi:hypothetical protein PACTADRAFT_18035 [Pachysolen tannophilus NRRL Y-2460]|uniref:CFEM domain-containing protein n=1 Tax=Pachysolen tannophilus NRRL Y-2460 TaxID=669874 RepID=A0A1E4TRD2_PACTA|nr:hypothetical protein PACTADRAFT_18035 [Pachysolen tannophilus NRRL Y-2460]
MKFSSVLILAAASSSAFSNFALAVPVNDTGVASYSSSSSSDSSDEEQQDKWPGFWCDKECTETVLFANGCKKTGLECICSSHFHYKLNKCRADGCAQNYKKKNWAERVEPLLEDCTDRYYEGPI